MIQIEIGATYNGMSWADAAVLARELQKFGMSDEGINELLEKNKDMKDEVEE